MFHFSGDIGNAARMKLVVNMLIGTVAAGLAESMALAEKIGLDQAALLRVLMLSDVASSLVETKGTGESLSYYCEIIFDRKVHEIE